jgi:hypothetical protein
VSAICAVALDGVALAAVVPEPAAPAERGEDRVPTLAEKVFAAGAFTLQQSVSQSFFAIATRPPGPLPSGNRHTDICGRESPIPVYGNAD